LIQQLPKYIHELQLMAIKAACERAGGRCYDCIFRNCEKSDLSGTTSYNCVFVSNGQKVQQPIPKLWNLMEQEDATVLNAIEFCLKNYYIYDKSHGLYCYECPFVQERKEVDGSKIVNGTTYSCKVKAQICAISCPICWPAASWCPETKKVAFLPNKPVEIYQFFKNINYQEICSDSYVFIRNINSSCNYCADNKTIKA